MLLGMRSLAAALQLEIYWVYIISLTGFILTLMPITSFMELIRSIPKTGYNQS
ncbi:hypothetical protein [Photorhabdus australis]|uniref:hypothetical protein n=1 Tax=Photorhabdus australis TaxID=286156 RepID=UPI0030D83C39